LGFGQPVIASSAGGAPEIIRNGREGFLVSPGNINALALCIDKLAEDRSLLLDMSLAALRRYCAHQTWGNTAALVDDFLCSMIVLKINPSSGTLPVSF
jgi:glycosyltransferase involved in cell wall biosynthesis